MMIAVGMSLVIATGGIDLSVGSLMAVAGAVSMEFLSDGAATAGSARRLAAVGLALLVTAILGAVNGILVAYVGLQPFIATLVHDARRSRHREGHHRRAEHVGHRTSPSAGSPTATSSASPSCSSSPS